MNDKFPIYRFEYDRDLGTNREDDGRFFKYWATHPDLGRCLFKAASPHDFTPEERRMDWREKVAGELGKLLGLPVARTELASVYIRARNLWLPGSVSLDYTPINGQTMSLRRFLSQVDPNYDNAYLDEYGDGYNVPNVMHHLERNSVELPFNWHEVDGIEDGVDLLVGYLMFDAWLSATDRHDENLEIAILETGYSLCPSFDHGDSLGAKLSPQERESGNFNNPRLNESCWWEKVEISTLRAFEIAARIRSRSAAIWQRRLELLCRDSIVEILNRIPESCIGDRDFVLSLLEFNRQQLMSLSIGE